MSEQDIFSWDSSNMHFSLGLALKPNLYFYVEPTQRCTGLHRNLHRNLRRRGYAVDPTQKYKLGLSLVCETGGIFRN